MKILVAVKRVIDYKVKIRVKSDQSGIETQNVKMSINPFDEIAVEEALRLKEQGVANEVIVVTIGDAACKDVLQHALAMGADRAILIETNKTFEPINRALILQKVIEQEQPQLILLGKQAIDDDCNQTGQMLAGLLNWAQGAFSSKIDVSGEACTVTREVDQGLETIELKLPAVITSDLRLNEPRYISMPNIMKAKSKPLDAIELSALSLELKPRTKIIKTEPPVKREAGKKVETFEEVIEAIEQKAEVLS